MKTARTLAIGVLAASITFIPVSAGASLEGSTGEANIEVTTVLVEHEGVSEQAAVTIVDSQEEFSRLVNDLELTEVNYAGAAIDPTDKHDAWISFVGDPSTEARQRLAEIPLNIEVRTDARFTANELRATLRDTHAALEAQPGIDGAAGYLDIAAQEIVLAAWPEDAETVSAARADAAYVSDVALEADGPKVEIITTTESVVTDEINGGMHLSNGCTSAFNVRDSSARKGFLTAAHCSNTVAGYAFVSAKESAGYDVQLHRAASVSNKIRYTSNGATRVITSWYYPGVGAAACNYGRTTGNKCTTIFTNDACWPGLGCGFYATNSGVTSGGDSGGPWYSGNSALGVHKGTMWLFGNKSVFTDMGNALSAMKVSLCTAVAC